MAARNVKQAGLYDPAEKLQSNTLKRHPKMDLNKTDLLRLLSYLEGELQARDVAIATLKTEKAKQLLYQAKYGRFGLGDPFMALQRDSDNMKDNSFDESAIKAMYDNQLAQLENLIATQRKAQLKMREQLATSEKKYHKVCSELEDEKRKHAQDTAQGDDVTYMLEKERERLKQEIDYEKSQNKKMEKDLKKTLASLEEERANSVKHKQVAVMLIKEQKKLIERLVQDRQKCNHYEQLLKDEKSKTVNMAEGLVQESKKSLKMEATMEKQLSDFDLEREQLKCKVGKEESKNRELQAQIEMLQHQVESLQKQLLLGTSGSKDSFQNIEIKATSSPTRNVDRIGGAALAVVSPTVGKSVPKSKIVIDGPGDRTYSPGGVESAIQKTVRYSNQSPARSPERIMGGASHVTIGPGDSHEMRVGPVGAVSVEKSGNENYRGARIGISPGSSAVISSGGKVLTVNVGSPNVSPNLSAGTTSPRKMVPAGRGTPPPLPPNKPILNSPVPGTKPAPPPKVGIAVTKDNDARGVGSKGVHIPVSVVRGGSGGSGRPSTGTDNSSPMRKPTQLTWQHQKDALDVTTSDAVSPLTNPATSSSASVTVQSPGSAALEFLGPEMADLQQLLSSIMSGNKTLRSRIQKKKDLLKKKFEQNEDSDSTHSLDSSSAPLSPACPADIIYSPVHKHAFEGDLDALQKLIQEREADVNLPLKDGTVPLLCAAENGHNDCLSLLLSRGANPNIPRDNKYSALHAAAARGHAQCVQTLLEHGANPGQGDQHNWTPLHLAATQGHTHCCRILLDHGASLSSYSSTTWTPLHCVVHAGHVDCLRTLLIHTPQSRHRDPPGSPSTSTSVDNYTQEAAKLVDKDGWTIAFIAAIRATHNCLDVIMNSCTVDLQQKDRFGRTIQDVASPRCAEYLRNTVTSQGVPMSVYLGINYPSLSSDPNTTFSLPSQQFVVGTIRVSQDMDWSALESCLQDVVSSYFSQLDTGFRTKRTSRLDPEFAMEAMQYTLGLGSGCIQRFVLGAHSWTVGTHPDSLPYSIICNIHNREIGIILERNVECVACDVLFPVSVLQNYLRLLEHYKSVVFYGAEASGKSYMAHRLADLVARKEQKEGKVAQIHHVTLHKDFTRRDMLHLLKNTGCLSKEDDSAARAPILILDDLEKVSIADVFGKLLNAIEHRGQHHRFTLDDTEGPGGTYFFLESFYIIATMNKARSTGLDLSVQQRFRWVHFRIDIEPIRNLLARHLLRKFIHVCRGQLPSSDSILFRAVEWIVCVWQRLNDGVGKLGLPDVMFGPYQFIKCPVESQDPNHIFSWLSSLWNDMISPVVREAVVKGTGKETSADGQQKVANTALYVLMQRAVVPGCPLSGSDKEQYLSTFAGSNELDLPLKMDKNRSMNNTSHHKRSLDFVTRASYSRPRQRHSFDGESSSQNTFDQSLQVTSKRGRSLSDMSSQQNFLNFGETKSEVEGSSSSSLAKMPKLEIRSPILTSLSMPFRSSSPSGYNSDTGESSERRFFTSSKAAFCSDDKESNSNEPPKTRRARSSENLSSSLVMQSRVSSPHLRTPSPFSFSLTTPTSSLNSFKFLEGKSRSENNNEPKTGLRRSLNSLDQLAGHKSDISSSRQLAQKRRSET